MTIPTLSLCFLLATTPIETPAREVASGVVVDSKGEAVTLAPGDCYVPQSRCVQYVTECERLRASEAELRKAAMPANAWVIVAIAIVAFGAGAGATWVALR